MSITITTPTNNSVFNLEVPVTFKGRVEGEVIRVELFAEQYYLGGDDVESGDWVLTYPAFKKPGMRKIKVVGFDNNGNRVASSEVAIILSNSSVGFEPGIDVSDYDNLVNWHQVRSAGFSFAFAKATEGNTWKANTFPRNWRQMQGAGIIRGAYHFFRPSVDAKEQARNFLDYVASVEPIQPEDLPPVLDLEHFPDSVRSEWEKIEETAERVNKVRTWIEVIETEIKRKPIIYTSFGFWSEFMSGVKDFSGYPLWVAHFTDEPKPLIPREWSTWTFWQYSDTTEVPGIPAPNEDGDRFNGSLSDLLAFIPSTIIT